MKHFEHVLVGTGQATGTLLGKLISTGKSIAVVEAGRFGGSCVNYGCTPTKTLVASARAFHIACKGGIYGFSSNPTLDFDRVMDRMNKIRNGSSNGMEAWLSNSKNITVFTGYAHFTDNKTLEVNGEKLTGENIYINVGTRQEAPPIPGLSSVSWLDNAGLLELKELPKHLVILGGGYIGVEFGQIFKRFGSEVTIIQRGEQLMPREDWDVAHSIHSLLEKEGLRVLLNANTTNIDQRGESIIVSIERDGHQEEISGDQLVIAAGRKPNSDYLNIQNTEISISEGGCIEVDEYCRTSVDGVFALGDVNGQGAYTHTSVNDAEIVVDFLFGGTRKISDRVMIYALFTDPALGRVGLSEKEAIRNGYKVLKSVRPMSQISRAIEMGETHGFAKLLVDAETDLILGAAIHGPGGDEIINMFAAIMHSGIPCYEYRKVVLVHPTVSELMPWVLDSLKAVN